MLPKLSALFFPKNLKNSKEPRPLLSRFQQHRRLFHAAPPRSAMLRRRSLQCSVAAPAAPESAPRRGVAEGIWAQIRRKSNTLFGIYKPLRHVFYLLPRFFQRLSIYINYMYALYRACAEARRPACRTYAPGSPSQAAALFMSSTNYRLRPTPQSPARASAPRAMVQPCLALPRP